MLRQKYKSFLRGFLSKEIRKYRTQRQLTQEQISERLCMAPRSYADLEHGACGCSGLTVMLFLLLLKDEEVLQLLHAAREELEEAGRHDAA
ncbi:MAG: helix-turn-helix domain-containing protein [Dysosmobacter sp.]|nr:helix-turn-helix domain-containing protein [Dysosmobacter sp.]